VGKEVPAHAVLSLGVAGHGLNGGAASELALNGCSDGALLSLRVNFEPMATSCDFADYPQSTCKTRKSEYLGGSFP